MTNGDLRRFAAPGLLVFGGWTLLALLFVPQAYFLNQRSPSPPGWGRAAIVQLPMFWGWAAMTPLVVWFGRRFSLERPYVLRHLLMYVAAGFFFSFVHLFVAGAGHWVLGRFIGVSRPFRLDTLAVSYGATNVMICWGILAGSQALTYFRRYQDRELRLVQAQLQSLRSQLHPHFLFNTLNAIAELLHTDPVRAERTLTRLSDLLRRALAHDGDEQVSLRHELDFLRGYVEIHQTLLGDRLAVEWSIADEALEAGVPALLLQPLVENAILHGVAPRASGGTIEVRASRDGDVLRLSVRDDGRGMHDQGAASAGGIGIRNTRARLRHIYGDAQTFQIAARDGGGVTVDLSIPFRGV